jgi:hypothetical protein
MKINIIILTFSFIFSFIGTLDLESGVAQSISVTAGTIYHAYIEAIHGKDVNIELSMASSTHKTSPFTTLHVYEYQSKYLTDDSDCFFHSELYAKESVKNNQLILTGGYELEDILVKKIGLKFVSSSDISNLSIKITISGSSTGEKAATAVIVIIIIIIVLCVICCIGIACVVKHCDQTPPTPKPVVQPAVYTPLQPQGQAQPIYQNQQYYPPVQQ